VRYANGAFFAFRPTGLDRIDCLSSREDTDWHSQAYCANWFWQIKRHGLLFSPYFIDIAMQRFREATHFLLRAFSFP